MLQVESYRCWEKTNNVAMSLSEGSRGGPLNPKLNRAERLGHLGHGPPL